MDANLRANYIPFTNQLRLEIEEFLHEVISNYYRDYRDQSSDYKKVLKELGKLMATQYDMNNANELLRQSKIVVYERHILEIGCTFLAIRMVGVNETLLKIYWSELYSNLLGITERFKNLGDSLIERNFASVEKWYNSSQYTKEDTVKKSLGDYEEYEEEYEPEINKTKGDTMNPTLNTLVNANKTAAMNQLKTEAGKVLLANAVELVTPLVPKMLRGYLKDPLASVVIINLVKAGVDMTGIKNKTLDYAIEAAYEGAYRTVMEKFDISGLSTKLLKGIELFPESTTEEK